MRVKFLNDIFETHDLGEVIAKYANQNGAADMLGRLVNVLADAGILQANDIDQLIEYMEQVTFINQNDSHAA